MFKKLTALATTLLLGAGLALVAVAAPASAHTPTVSATCSTLTVKLASYEGPGKPNNVKVTVDGSVVDNVDFGESFGPKDYAFANNTSSHSWKVEIDAKGTGYDKLGANALTGTSTPCALPQGYNLKCDAITVDYGRALVNGDHINMDISINGGPTFQRNAYVDQNVLGGYNPDASKTTGLGLVINGYPSVPLTKDQVATGRIVFNYGAIVGSTYFTVQWVQMNSNYFNQNRDTTKFFSCGTVPIPQDAAATYTITPATCAAPEQLVLNTPTNATWGAATAVSGPNDSTSPAVPFSATATATDKHAFPGGSTTKTVTRSLAGILPPTGSCAPPCITKANVSYTYFPNSNSGVVTVKDVVGSSHVLCQPFWVTATSWKYTTDQVWPQVRDVVQYVNAPYTDGISISGPGTYPYVAAVTCGQGDIYASFTGQPEPTPTLTAPGQPFVETFLHNMGFATSTPGNTWVQQTPGCNTTPVVTPTATSITECGAYGSVTVPADTAMIDYTLTGDGKTGHNVVTAAPIGNAVLVGYPAGGWSFELGNFVECQTECPAVLPTVTSTNLDQGLWDFATESRSGGHREYVDGGLHIWTDNATSVDKSAGYYPTNFPLADAGIPTITYTDTNTPAQAAPGVNLTLFVNGVWKGNLVHEPLFDKWWINKAIAGLPAGPNPSYQLAYGTIDEILFAYAQQGITSDKLTVQAVGFSLGSGAKGDGTITQLTAGCTNYVFDNLTVNPKATLSLGACYPNGFDENGENPTFSSKNVTFTFDNTDSDVPVLFEVPNASPAISVVVPAHTKQDVETAPMYNLGGSWDVILNGDAANPVHLTVDAFPNCYDGGGVPADPKHTDEICVSGVVTSGSITVDVKPSLVYTVTNTDTNTVYPTDANGVAAVPAGHYEVTVVAAPGFVVTGIDNWKYVVEILAPQHCETIPVPVATNKAITCDADGSYTLPEQAGVIWSVGGVVVDPKTYKVPTATSVHIEAAADIKNGYGFATDPQVVTWDFTFNAPTGCQLITHPLVTPANVTFKSPTCFSDGSYTIPATEGVFWFIGNNKVNPGEYQVQEATNLTVVATPDAPDYGFEQNVKTSWDVVIPAPPTPAECDLVTHPLVTPAAVTHTQPTCLSDGSYTIPSTEGVDYSIGGSIVGAGTYTVKGAQSILVTAAAQAPDYGLEDNAQTSWPLDFSARPTDCLTQLTTLAVTGVSVGGGLAFAAGLVMLGIAGIFVRRRFIADK